MNKSHSVDDVEAFLLLLKELVREMEWTDRPSLKTPQWLQFESRLFLGPEISDEVKFIAHYRPFANVVKGSAVIEIPEALFVSLLWRDDRIIAIDTCPGQSHTNVKGSGRPYHGQTISSTTHIHIWTEHGAGYVEPIEPPLMEPEEIIAEFCARVNLCLNGAFVHPMQGKQLKLLQWTAQK